MYNDIDEDGEMYGSAPQSSLSSPFNVFPNNTIEANLTLAAHSILDKLYQQSQNGNTNASKILLDRILPPRKLTTTLPSLPILFNNELTLQQQAEIVMDLTFKGSITVEASNALLNGIKIRSDLDQAAKLVELEAKLNALIEEDN